MAFTRALLTRIGGFDPALGAGTRARGGDDLAAFATALLSGARIAYTPDAVVRHRHHADYEALQRMAHGYGVGLGAYLTSLVVQKPGVVPALVRRVPGGLRHLLAAGSPKNVGIEPDYPADLIKIERVGVLQGPFRYGLSRLDSRRAARHQTARLAAAAVRTGHHSHAATAVAGSPVANVCEHAHVSSSRSTSTQESR
jgi:hypothetical protein